MVFNNSSLKAAGKNLGLAMLPLASFSVPSACFAPVQHVRRGSGGDPAANGIGSATLGVSAVVTSVGRLKQSQHSRQSRCAERVASPQRQRRSRLRLRDLRVGQELRGIVKAIFPKHALVDVGAECDAALHVSKMARGNASPRDVVSEGMEIRVWVGGTRSEGWGSNSQEGLTWKVDAKLEVTMLDPKELSVDVSEFVSLPSDALLAARVSRIEDYGIFVLVRPPSGGAPVQGFVHVSEIKDGFVNHPGDEVEMDQELTVRLLRVDRKFGRLRLSMKLPEVEGY